VRLWRRLRGGPRGLAAGQCVLLLLLLLLVLVLMLLLPAGLRASAA
jgi:hypothetical protein